MHYRRYVVDHRLDIPLDWVLPVLVGCVGLSLNTVLGLVRAYLPRLECSKVVGSNDLDLDFVSLVVQTHDLESFEVHILGYFFVRASGRTYAWCLYLSI